MRCLIAHLLYASLPLFISDLNIIHGWLASVDEFTFYVPVLTAALVSITSLLLTICFSSLLFLTRSLIFSAHCPQRFL